jgi:hypothetical protein
MQDELDVEKLSELLAVRALDADRHCVLAQNLIEFEATFEAFLGTSWPEWCSLYIAAFSCDISWRLELIEDVMLLCSLRRLKLRLRVRERLGASAHGCIVIDVGGRLVKSGPWRVTTVAAMGT